MFSSRNFKRSGLTFKYLHYFTLIFGYGCKTRARFHFSPCGYPVFPTPFIINSSSLEFRLSDWSHNSLVWLWRQKEYAKCKTTREGKEFISEISSLSNSTKHWMICLQNYWAWEILTFKVFKPQFLNY